MVMDVLAMLVLTMQVVFPIVVDLGFDPVWFGVLMLINLEMGQITPPFGLNLFVMKSMTDTRLQTVYRGVLPFCAADFIKLALLVAIPTLALWLPSTMFE